MQIFHQGKIAKKIFKLGAISACLFLTGCEVDGSSNEAPVFDQQALDNPYVAIGVSYEGKLSASDTDGDALLYTKVSGPDWLTINQNGTLSVTSDDNGMVSLSEDDAGGHLIVVKVDDGHATDEVGISVIVDHAPVFSENVVDVNIVDAGTSYAGNIEVNDNDGDALTYTLVDAPAWLALDGSVLTAEPTLSDVEVHNVTVSVTDGVTVSQKTFPLTVTAGQFFSADIVQKGGAVAGAEFIGTLSGDASGEGELSFELVPEQDEEGNDIIPWLSVAENGELSGVYNGAIDNSFRVKVTDAGSGYSSVAVIKITQAAFLPFSIDERAVFVGWPYEAKVFGNDGVESEEEFLTYSFDLDNDLFEISTDGNISTKRDIIEADAGQHLIDTTVSDGTVTATVALDVLVKGSADLQDLGTIYGFEDGTGTWFNPLGAGGIDSHKTSDATGTWGARVRNGASMQNFFSTVGKSDIKVSYAREAVKLVGEESLMVQWSIDGITWATLETVNSTVEIVAGEEVHTPSDYDTAEFTLPAEADDKAVVAVRFVVTSNLWAEKANIDDVLVSGTDI